MTKGQNSPQYDLEERTLKFAKGAVGFCRRLPKTVIDNEIAKQLTRAATSVGANYIEANEALSKKDFLMRIKLCRKEAKETRYWIRLLELGTSELKFEQEALLQEATELMKIFGSILTKSQ
ncbi:MAG: four helix bundle protein [Chloroflexi bacterium]|nr:four helix bundle protein [Chloroflexota bacterium]MBM4454216.1 four helix bundle protein [Chloroflexota bacterium]